MDKRKIEIKKGIPFVVTDTCQVDDLSWLNEVCEPVEYTTEELEDMYKQYVNKVVKRWKI